MAKQAGGMKIRGEIGGVCFYKLEGEYYARKKSSLNGRRVKRDPAFKETMKHAELLAKASVIASVVYRRLTKAIRKRKVYQQLTGKAMNLLKQGMSEEEIINTISVATLC